MMLSTFLKPGSLVAYMFSVSIYPQYVQLPSEYGYARDQLTKPILIQV